ncbi:hypothetical protein CEXT_203311, partial [Caerostris extrusa]
QACRLAAPDLISYAIGHIFSSSIVLFIYSQPEISALSVQQTAHSTVPSKAGGTAHQRLGRCICYGFLAMWDSLAAISALRTNCPTDCLCPAECRIKLELLTGDWASTFAVGGHLSTVCSTDCLRPVQCCTKQAELLSSDWATTFAMPS